MNRLWLPLALLLLLVSALPALADDLALTVDEVNVSARADRHGFRARVAAEFGISEDRFDRMSAKLGSDGDAYLCLRIGKASGRSCDDLGREYNKNRGRGWGVIAQEAGIKPGSSEFHALKEHGYKSKNGKNGKDKGKDRDRDNGKNSKGKKD